MPGSEEPGVDGFVVGSGCVVVRSEVEVAGVVAPVVCSVVVVGSGVESSGVVVAGVVDPPASSTWMSMVSVITLASLVTISTFAVPEDFGVPVILLASWS